MNMTLDNSEMLQGIKTVSVCICSIVSSTPECSVDD